MTDLVLSVDDVLDLKSCAILRNELEAIWKFKTGTAFPWEEGNAIRFQDVQNPVVKCILTAYRFKLSQIVSSHYKMFLYPHLTDLIAWSAGKQMEAHLDNGTNAPPGHLFRQTLAPRVVSSITYLNDDFGGGETFVQNLQGGVYVHPPKTGNMLAFTSDERCVHGVNKVTMGNRYTIAMWFTDQPNHCEMG